MVRRRLSADEIVAEALELIDSEGLGALTMRALATRIGVPVMNLYHYVATRDELLDRVAELAFASADVTTISNAQADRLEALFGALYDYLVTHPGIAALFADRALSGPAVYHAADEVLRELLARGYDDRSAVHLFTALLSYTLGAAMFSNARSEHSPAGARAAYRDRLDAVTTDRYPSLVRVREQLDVRGTREQFSFGLSRLLD